MNEFTIEETVENINKAMENVEALRKFEEIIKPEKCDKIRDFFIKHGMDEKTASIATLEVGIAFKNSEVY